MRTATKTKLVCASVLSLAAASKTRADIIYNGGALNPPDNTPAGVMSILNVPDSYNIANLQIALTFGSPNHTWAGDIVVTLTHNATTLTLFQRIGSSTPTGLGDSSDLGGTYTFTDSAGTTRMIDVANPLASGVVITPGNFRATNNTFNGNGTPTFTGEQIQSILAAFGGTNVNGNWTLTVSDNAAGDTGMLTGWQLIVAAPIPEPTTFALMAVAGAGVLGLRAWRKRGAA